jgi:hypothetical protein
VSSDIKPLENSRGHAEYHDIVRNIANDNGIRTNRHIISDGHPAKYFCASANLHMITNLGRTQWVIVAAIPHRDALADHTIITNNSVSMNTDTAVMLNIEPPAYLRGRVDVDAEKHLGQLVQDNMGNRPGRANELVFDNKSGMPKPINQQRPKAKGEQTLTVGFEILNNLDHRSGAMGSCLFSIFATPRVDEMYQILGVAQ